jgi:hypothetical protein
MATKGVLRVIDGNVKFYNESNMIQKIYYNSGDAQRADWFDRENESIEVLLKDGKTIIINQGAQIVKVYW